MDNRTQILMAITKNKPSALPLPLDIDLGIRKTDDLCHQFITNAFAIGSKVVEVSSYNEIEEILAINSITAKRRVTNVPQLTQIATLLQSDTIENQHELEDVDLTILRAHFGVAENGAIWITDTLLPHRILPFITQHLVLIITKNDLVMQMSDAYAKIGTTDYNYGVFIAGPSKTADIEQSLVIGAHGPRSLQIFITTQN